MRISWLNLIAGSIAVIGALNWGAVGLFNLNLARTLFRSSRMAERTVYSLIGLAGLFLLLNLSLMQRGALNMPRRRLFGRHKH